MDAAIRFGKLNGSNYALETSANCKSWNASVGGDFKIAESSTFSLKEKEPAQIQENRGHH